MRVCDECNYGSYSGRCVICGGIGISDAYYCKVFPAAALVVSMFERTTLVKRRQCLPLHQSPPRKGIRVRRMWWTRPALFEINQGSEHSALREHKRLPRAVICLPLVQQAGYGTLLQHTAAGATSRTGSLCDSFI